MPTQTHTPIRTDPLTITWVKEERRNLNSYVALLGRILFGGFFVFSGVNHFVALSALTAAAAAAGVPLPQAGVVVGGLLMLAGGLSIVLGIKPRVGACLPILFLLPAAFMIHDFWNENDAMARQLNQIFFLRNLAFVGALLMLSTIPRWPLSLERKGG